MGNMLDNLLEQAGYLALVGFAYLCWPPAALLAAGLILTLTSNMRTVKRKRAADPTAAARRPDWLTRAARAVAAYRGSP